MVSKKLKNLLKSSPSTIGLIKYLEELEKKIVTGNSSNDGSSYDDTELVNRITALENKTYDLESELESLLDSAIEEENNS